MTQIPLGTELKYFNSTLYNVGLQNKFSAAIRMVATNILKDENSTPQLKKIAIAVANNPIAMDVLTKNAISYALSSGAIITSSSTLLDNKEGTFDDSTVLDDTIIAIVEELAANSALLTTLGYED